MGMWSRILAKGDACRSAMRMSNRNYQDILKICEQPTG